MEVYGPTLYGTRGGEVSPRDWGVMTRKGDKRYVHVLDLPDKGLFVPVTGMKVKRAKEFASGKPVRFKQDKEGVWLLFGKVPEEVDYVIELEIQ